MTVFVLQLYTIVNVFSGNMLSFSSYKNNNYSHV